MMLLLRLRDALIDSISQAVVQLVSELNREIIVKLSKDVFYPIGGSLIELGNNTQLLSALIDQEQPKTAVAGNPYAHLLACRLPVPGEN